MATQKDINNFLRQVNPDNPALQEIVERNDSIIYQKMRSNEQQKDAAQKKIKTEIEDQEKNEQIRRRIEEAEARSRHASMLADSSVSASDQAITEAYYNTSRFENMGVMGDATIYEGADGIRSIRAEIPWEYLPFGYFMLAPNLVRIYEGKVFFHSENSLLVIPESDITLTGADGWLVLEIDRFTQDYEYKFLHSLPVMTSDTMSLVIHKFQNLAPDVFTWVKWEALNYNFALPLRTS